MNLADFVVNACVKKDALCGGGFTSIDMGHDADISHLG